MGLDAGEISGEITVAIVEGVLDYYVSHGQETPRYITCAIYADENGVDPVHSVLPMAEGVAAGDISASDITIESHADNTAAIRTGGEGTFTVTSASIRLIGDGGDDFTGIGSALGAADTSTLEVTDSVIYTEGIIRCAIFAGDEGTIKLSDSDIKCEPGEYVASVSIPSAGMASPPNGLGIWGNCRAMNLVDAATVEIVGCNITSQNWGALGVDDVSDGHLDVYDSVITIEEQGYGSYSIGNCDDVFDNCVFEIAYGVVGYAAAGDGSTITLCNGTTANSMKYYGIVTHQSFNGLNSVITVTGQDTSLNTGLGGIIAKGRGADIIISDGAVVTAESGVLVRAQINDDTGAGSMDGTEVVNVTISNTELTGDIVQGMGAPYGDETIDDETSASAASVDAAASSDASASGNAAGPMGPGGPGGSTNATTESVMNVTIENATLTGAITSAELTLAIEDGNISMDNITDVGVVTETVYTSNPYAVCNVTLASGAVWNVDKASYLMSLTVSDGATLNGYVVVDGQLTSPEAGKTYTGDIAVFATEDEAKAFAEASANDTASADTTGTGEDTAKTGISPAVIVVIIIVVILAACGIGYGVSKSKKKE